MRAETATAWQYINVPVSRPEPKAAQLAQDHVNLVTFAQKAGDNILSVIPENYP